MVKKAINIFLIALLLIIVVWLIRWDVVSSKVNEVGVTISRIDRLTGQEWILRYDNNNGLIEDKPLITDNDIIAYAKTVDDSYHSITEVNSVEVDSVPAGAFDSSSVALDIAEHSLIDQAHQKRHLVTTIWTVLSITVFVIVFIAWILVTRRLTKNSPLDDQKDLHKPV